jgi:hypothetical protein
VVATASSTNEETAATFIGPMASIEGAMEVWASLAHFCFRELLLALSFLLFAANVLFLSSTRARVFILVIDLWSFTLNLYLLNLHLLLLSLLLLAAKVLLFFCTRSGVLVLAFNS